MVEKRDTRGRAEDVLRLGWTTEGEEDKGLETAEEMRDGQVRGDLWVSRLNAEQEADMMQKEKREGAIPKRYDVAMPPGQRGREGEES